MADIEVARTQFKQLIAANPSYFGTLSKDIAQYLPPSLPKQGDTAYEESRNGTQPTRRICSIVGLQGEHRCGHGGTHDNHRPGGHSLQLNGRTRIREPG